MAQTVFNSAVDRWVNRTRGGVKQRVKTLAIALHDRIVLRTPVDTGRARASWNVIQGDDADLSVAPDDFRGAGTAEAQAKQSALVASDAFVISNNLPYIEGLENGTSKQAPNGMVRLAIADVQTLVELQG